MVDICHMLATVFKERINFWASVDTGGVWEDVGMGWVVATAKTVKWHNTNGRVQGDYDVY